MKYAFASLAALALLATTASAATNYDERCTILKANWQQAPDQQCGRILANGSQYKAPEYPAPMINVPEIPVSDVIG